MTSVQILITPQGQSRMVYDDLVDLNGVGEIAVKRASHVEPNKAGCWTADLNPVGGPILGPFDKRSEALAAEVAWLHRNWLVRFAH